MYCYALRRDARPKRVSKLEQTYNTSNATATLDSIGTISTFTSFGRKSNKNDYYVYKVAGTGSNKTYTRVVPVSQPDEILTGLAVEFRYWSTNLTAAMLASTSVADRYAFFYVDDSNQLDVDFGTSTGGPTGGAINAAGHRVTGNGITTVILAHNVTSVAFSHTAKDIAGDGEGCVRMKLVVKDIRTIKQILFSRRLISETSGLSSTYRNQYYEYLNKN